MDILDDLRGVVELNGDTYSSAEVLGMVGRAAAEIERLRHENEYAFAPSGPVADVMADNERLRALLHRCQVAWVWVEDDSDLAVEVRAALERK